jgi:hypothetical protein
MMQAGDFRFLPGSGPLAGADGRRYSAATAAPGRARPRKPSVGAIAMAHPAAGETELDPWPKRVAVFAVLVAIAVASIWLIDARAMHRQRRMQQQDRRQHEPAGMQSAAPARIKNSQTAQSNV